MESLPAVVRTLVVGVLAYVALVLLLRASGKRTLSKWNAFDLVVTVALGSSLATTLLSGTTSLGQGVAGLALLVLLQFVITRAAVRWRWVERLVKAEPTLLLYRGKFQEQAMREQRVTRAEVLAALRGKGIGAVAEADAVVLETDGSFSVIQSLDTQARGVLEGVEGVPPGEPGPRGG